MYEWRLECLELARRYAKENELELEGHLGHLEHYHYGGTQACDQWVIGLGITEHDVVVDVGSGVGGTGRHLTKNTGCDVVGVEVRAEFVDEASRWEAPTIHGDGATIEIPDHDVSLFILSLGHMNIESALKNVLNRNRSRRFLIEVIDNENTLKRIEDALSSIRWDFYVEDVTARWAEWTAERTVRFRKHEDFFIQLYGTKRVQQRLTLYDRIASDFATGSARGFRVASIQMPCAFDIQTANIIEFDQILE